MSTPDAPVPTSNTSRSLTPIHILLSVQSLVVILVSVNRLTTLTTGYVTANEFLRWVDFNNMLVLPLISLLAFYLLKKHIERGILVYHGPWHLSVNLAFVVGIYLTGVSYGDHEVTNYLHIRFCAEEPTSDLCRIIIFNDDAFSHWLFFAGFVLVNASLLLIQLLFPYSTPLTQEDVAMLIGNGFFIGLGIFANLAFEAIGFDLYIVAALALLALGLLWHKGPQPLFVYYSTAYGLGLIATGTLKMVS